MKHKHTAIRIICAAISVISMLVVLWIAFRPKAEITVFHYETNDVNEYSIPMKFYHGSLFVECQVNDKPAVMKIDTGANICVFDEDKLDQFDIQKTGSSRNVRLIGDAYVESSFLEPFTIKFPSVGIKAYVKLADSIPHSPEKGYDYDCLLGGDFLSTIGACIDYPSRRLLFQCKEGVKKLIQETP